MSDFGALVSINDRVLIAVAAGTVLLYLGGHVFLRRGAGAATRWLGLLLLSGAINMLCLGAWRGVYEPSISAWAFTISATAVSVVCFFTLLFTYHFLGDDRPRERRIATLICGLVLVPTVARLVVSAMYGVIEYQPGTTVFYFNVRGTPAEVIRSHVSPGYTTYTVLGTYAWLTLVLLRKCVRLERTEGGGRAWRALLRPRSSRARAARDFAILVVGLVAVQVVGMAGTGAGSIVILLLSCACVWVHINHSSEPTRLRFKLTTMPLAVVVGLQALLFASSVRDSREHAAADMRRQTQVVRALIDRGGPLSGEDVGPGVRFVATRPASDGAYSERHAPLFVRDGFDTEVLDRSDARERDWLVDWVIRSGFDGEAGLDEADRRRALLEDLRTGDRVRWSGWTDWAFYGNLLPREDHYRAYRWEQDDVTYLVGWSEADHRRRATELGARLLLVILATGSALVIGLPLLYRASILRPLAALISGVRRVDRGDLSEHVPVRTTDELGVLAGSFNSMTDSIQDARETLEQINAAAFRFVPRAFLKLLGHQSILSVELGNQTRRTMTVLFADVRDFTSLSERMTPDETFAFVNDLLRALGPLIRRHGGFIDKYLGDAIMALFDGGADEALLAAIEMLDALAGLNERRSAAGLPPVRMGVGLHTGDLMLGVIGEEERIDGTVLSDAVNTASRLEGLTKRYGVPILVSGETIAALAAPERFELRSVESVQVKGRERAVALHEVVGLAPERAERAEG